ncbi:MAG: bifunctional phosphoglucose/phosphomannose isomerase [Dehalococcoidia bacterium]|nr:bifunctional phosphoglucose/phosphomannose isomerase [Dehalococcoidia bacterium]
MIDLDALDICRKIDKGGMRLHLLDFPGYCSEAWEDALRFEFELASGCGEIDTVLVLGMGGSAIAGDLLAGLRLSDSRTRMLVHRDYDLPGSVDAGTLVIASSYSGMTEETISAFKQSLATPAKKLVLTSGGILKSLAEEHGIPVFPVNHPGPPRAALAHSFFPLLGICQKLGIMPDAKPDVDEMLLTLKKLQDICTDTCPTVRNPAKKLANSLFGNLAVIYGAGYLCPVAQRWKTQINENSKSLAVYEFFPELNHNAVMGYRFPAEVLDRSFVVLLRSPHLHPRTLMRYRFTAELMDQAGIRHETVDGTGDSALSQVFSLVLLGDWVSYYLALLNETDPSLVSAIDFLKKRLADS